jgi:phospholipid/cholesterol/gamma-HCH transport system permease protein
VELSGRLDATTLPDVWRDVVPNLPAKLDGDLHAECSGLGYCDGAGLGLLVYLKRRAEESGVGVAFAGLNDGLRGLLERSDPGPRPPPKPPAGAVVKLGRATSEVAQTVIAMVSFLGELLLAFIWAVTHPHKVRWRDVLLIAEKAGAEAVPVVCLLGWLMGVIISFQSVPVLSDLGVESMIPTMLAFAMVRELGPLVTAIILAGRSGSAFAAELGTMKVTEEINALTTFGLDPARFLVVPRILAAVIVTPLLSVFGTLFGLMGGYLIMATLGYGLPFYVNQVASAVDWVDLLQGVFKAGVFAFLIAAIGCLKGLQTRSGPGAVGDSTTKAVVAGIVMIVVADGVLGVTFFYLGI